MQTHSCLQRLLPITVALLAIMPAASHAQVPRAPFVEGSVLLESDYAGGGGGRSLTAGGVVEVGISLTDRYSLSFGAEIPGWHTGEDLAGLVLSRTTSYSFLITRRFHPTRRVQVEALAGFSVMTSSDRRPNRNVGWEWVPEETDHWMAPSIGLGVPISLTRRLTIVPEFRLHLGLPGLLSDPYGSAHDLSRLRLGMRWQF